MGLMPLEKKEETEDSPLSVCVPTEQGHVTTSRKKVLIKNPTMLPSYSWPSSLQNCVK